MTKACEERKMGEWILLNIRAWRNCGGHELCWLGSADRGETRDILRRLESDNGEEEGGLTQAMNEWRASPRYQ